MPHRFRLHLFFFLFRHIKIRQLLIGSKILILRFILKFTNSWKIQYTFENWRSFILLSFNHSVGTLLRLVVAFMIEVRACSAVLTLIKYQTLIRTRISCLNWQSDLSLRIWLSSSRQEFFIYWHFSKFHKDLIIPNGSNFRINGRGCFRSLALRFSMC